MDVVLRYILAFLVGAALGVFYFLGLWYTIRRLPKLQRPYLIFFVSLLVRMVLLLGGIYLLARTDWRMVIPAMVGVILARVALVRRFRCECPGPGGKEAAGNDGH